MPKAFVCAPREAKRAQVLRPHLSVSGVRL